MNHHKLFNDKASLYESARPLYPAEVFSYLRDLCASTGSGETSVVWDCACGNGQAAIDLVKHFDIVYASDVSEEQIRNAKQHPRIYYSLEHVEKPKLETGSLDLVCVAQALHWFDYDLFWPQVQRVLKPGGIFSAWGYNLPVVNAEIDRFIQRKILDIIEPYWATQNQLIWNHYRDIDFPFKRLETPLFDMTMELNLDELFTLIHTFSATRRCMDKIGESFFNEAYRKVAKAWGEAKLKKKIAFDFVFYAGVNQ